MDKKNKLAKAIRTGTPVNLRIKRGGPIQLMLTQAQVKKLEKAPGAVVVKISQSNIGQQGGSLVGALMKFAPVAAKLGSKAAAKILPPLATGALSALSSLGIDSLFGKGIAIPQAFMKNLIGLKELAKSQLDKVKKGVQSGRGMTLKPTKKQIEGGFLGDVSCHWDSHGH